MFGLALVIVFIERTSLLIKLCLLSGAVLLGVFCFFCLLALPDRGKKAVSNLTLIEAIIGILYMKEQDIPNFIAELQMFYILWIFLCLISFILF